ncbi:MAG: hypothetical protein U1E45_03685 [Geminicoccaceae bacterium]
MAFKPNYNQQRAERKRAKEAKKEERLQRREADAKKRKADKEAGIVTDLAPAPDNEET